MKMMYKVNYIINDKVYDSFFDTKKLLKCFVRRWLTMGVMLL